MTDNDLFAKIIAVLEAGLATWPFVGPFGPVDVQQKQQPTRQGAPGGPAIFLEKLFDHVYGFSALVYTPDVLPDKVQEAEDQVYTSTFQISTLVPQDPTNLNIPTASDLASVARAILQRRVALRQFAQDNIGVLRVMDIQNAYSTNDQDRQAANPSFDLVLTYVRSTPPVTIDTITRVDSTIVQIP